MGIIARINKIKESHTFRWASAVLAVLLVIGALGYTAVPQKAGNIVDLDPEDVDQLIFYILEILKIVLGYLLGRKVRSVFKV